MSLHIRILINKINYSIAYIHKLTIFEAISLHFQSHARGIIGMKLGMEFLTLESGCLFF